MYLHTSLIKNGFDIVENIFTEEEIKCIIQEIDSHGVFAIRHFLGVYPNIQKLIFNTAFQALVDSLGEGYQLVKSIYFDKPPKANWVVNWHQDLTISVKEKYEYQGFTHWLPKEGYFSVQPPLHYLENIVTLRIHLDDCHQYNGALRVIPQSHQQIRHEKELPINFFDTETICKGGKGGVLLMKPLIWHSSKRAENQAQRRVIHLEFSNLELPTPLTWAERNS